MKPVLTIEKARRVYGAKAAVEDASLILRPGRITCLLGPSGCGKSTLLRLIAGLEPVDGGIISGPHEVLSEPGVHVPPEARGIGLVFQDYALFPHLTILDNVAFGLSGRPKLERRERAMRQLRHVRLADRADHYPQTLSGGEQQRVALARALAREPAAVLLDEPFSGLDATLRAEVRDAALHALRATSAAVLIVTHDAEEAMLTADDLALMQSGRILQTGSPQDCYLDPVTVEAARLLGEVNLLPARVSGGLAATPFGEVPAPSRADGPCVVMARPEAFSLGPEGAPASVTDVRFGGASSAVTLAMADTHARARVPSEQAPHAGEGVKVTLNPRFCRVFDAT
jgi:iron(III) transport system ATP-binding protein